MSVQLMQEDAEKYREIIRKAIEGLEDKDAVEAPLLFDRWQPDVEYKAGERICFDGALYSVLQQHTSLPSWTPDVAVSLFARVLIPDPDVVPDWVQPDSTNPYMTGDKVRHNDKIWESTIDNNVWEPGVYGWVEVEE